MDQRQTDLAGQHEKTSLILTRTLQSFEGANTNVGTLLYKLRRRSFGGVLLILAVLSLIPGVGIFSGILMMILGIQLCVGFRSPKLMRSINKRTISVDHIRYMLNRVIPSIEKAERFIKPRWLFFTGVPLNILVGLVTFLLSIFVILPLPFTNLLPTLSIVIFSIGLMERDGLFILFGLIIASCALLVGAAIVYFALQGAAHMF